MKCCHQERFFDERFFDERFFGCECFFGAILDASILAHKGCLISLRLEAFNALG